MAELKIRQSIKLRTANGVREYGNPAEVVSIPLDGGGKVYHHRFDDVDTTDGAVVLWEPNLSLFPSGFKMCLVRSSKQGYVSVSSEIANATDVQVRMYPTAISSSTYTDGTYTDVDEDPFHSTSDLVYGDSLYIVDAGDASAILTFGGPHDPFVPGTDKQLVVAKIRCVVNPMNVFSLKLYENNAYVADLTEIIKQPLGDMLGGDEQIVLAYFDSDLLSSPTATPQIKVRLAAIGGAVDAISIYPTVDTAASSTSSWPIYPSVWTSLGGFSITSLGTSGDDDAVARLANDEEEIVQVAYIVDPDETDKTADVEILVVS
jgi:hypothetical protein